MYLEAVGKGFFTKLNIELSICLQKMTQKSVKNAIISKMGGDIKKFQNLDPPIIFNFVEGLTSKFF